MLSEIFLNLSQDLLEAFREIDHYSVAGMLQVINYIYLLFLRKNYKFIYIYNIKYKIIHI